MQRRDFIKAIAGSIVAWPLAARAQQPMPVVGFLNGESPESYAKFAAAFRKGLSETGYVEGQNVTVEYRWASGQYDRLPALAADLVEHKVAVIAASGGDGATYAARTATATIPIVFLMGGDPVKLGVVASYNKPAGNLTGVTLILNDLMAKRLELMLELVPQAKLVAFLGDPNSPISELQGREFRDAAIAKGLQSVVAAKATNPAEVSAAFANLFQQKVDAIIVEASSYFQSQRELLVTLAARYALPTMYYSREFVTAGGLVSYGASIPDIYRQVGIYSGRLLKGAKPADLPILRPTKFELALNVKTAKALGLAVPQSTLLRADEIVDE